MFGNYKGTIPAENCVSLGCQYFAAMCQFLSFVVEAILWWKKLRDFIYIKDAWHCFNVN